jgi:hypothetical protein
VRARARPFLAAFVAALALAPASAAAAPTSAQSLEYSRVISVYGADGAHLPPCAFTQAQLQAALAGIPRAIATTVPDFKRALRAAITAHERGDCKGVKATGESQAAGIGGAGAPPETTTTPTTPATTPTGATTPPAATTPTQPATTVPTTPAPAATAPASHAGGSGGGRDRTPLAVAAIAIGALLLALLGLWSLARARGWDAPRLARARHAWGEAGFRTSGMWAEFADWLRLGR